MSEYSAVQAPMLKYAAEIGWLRVSRDQAMQWRGDITGQFFLPVLEEQLLALNPGVLNAERVADVIRRLRLLPATLEGNRDALLWLRGQMSVYVPDEGRERDVTLIDFDRPDTNVYHVTDEWRHQGAALTNRADVVFLINGVPVALAELKAAEKASGAADGVEQVRRYHRETPEMLVFPQVFEVTQLFDFYYGVTWAVNCKGLFNWKDEQPGDYERKVKAFFDRPRFLQVLREYVRFLTVESVLSKIILRQHQVRAIEKVTERVADPVRRKGLIWHGQGSGKTLTMISIAARVLRGTLFGEKPTVLMLIDRNELSDQLDKNIKGYGITTHRIAASKEDLRKMLADDHRGLIVSMIHKFDGLPAHITDRRSVVVLVDEAHRTTGGDLGTYLMAALPHAAYIGFTGTPIDNLAKGKGTFKTFGPDDPQGYLDKYTMRESVEDGTTLRLNYALAPADLRVDRQTLEERFLSLTEAEGVTDVEELNAILDRAVALKELMKAPDRIERIAATIAQHFRDTVEPLGFKAFVVAVDREACAFYKQALDRHLPPEMSRVVISAAHNDPALLKQYYLGETEERDVRKDFVQPGKDPQILIVTEKLLTGFDAPILYCLYLDKPMRDHVLLQTLARVNRPYEDGQGQVKPCGFVLDFVGLFERLEKALAFDSDVVASVIQNIDVLEKLFETMMAEQGAAYLPLAAGWDDKAKERAVEHFRDPEVREKFFKFFKQMQTLYDILSPSAFLRPFVGDYQSLSLLYALVRNAYTDTVYVDRELTAKTRELLRQTTTATDIDLPNKIHRLGAEELAALRQSGDSDTTKILNLRKALAVIVNMEGDTKPFVVGIGERAEALREAFEERRETTEAVLAAFEKLAKQYVDADAERLRLGVDENTFALYAALKGFLPGVTAAQAETINATFLKFPDFKWDGGQEAELRSALYVQVRPLVKGQMISVTDALMKLKRV